MRIIDFCKAIRDFQKKESQHPGPKKIWLKLAGTSNEWLDRAVALQRSPTHVRSPRKATADTPSAADRSSRRSL
jgi:hypothetical protein